MLAAISEALVSFVAMTLLLGTIFQLLAVHFGPANSGRIWLLPAMWAPAIAAFCTGAANRQMAWTAVKRSGWRYLGAGLLLGWAPTVMQTIFLAITGGGRWDSQHYPLALDGRSIMAIHRRSVLWGTGPQSFAHFGLNLALSIAVASVMVAVIGGIGEEIGWRGVLQPSLEARYGRLRGTLYVGLIWAYWHLPVNLAGYNDSSHPVLNALVLFPVAVVAMSFVFAWLARRSGSVWPAALAHGANNTINGAFLVTALTPGIDSASLLIAMLLVAAIFIVSTARNHSRSLATWAASSGAQFSKSTL